MGSKKGASALPDSGDDAVLIRESVATGLEDDLLERGQRLRLRGEADGGPKASTGGAARRDTSQPPGYQQARGGSFSFGESSNSGERGADQADAQSGSRSVSAALAAVRGQEGDCDRFRLRGPDPAPGA
jgi:hypothetical protein